MPTERSRCSATNAPKRCSRSASTAAPASRRSPAQVPTPLLALTSLEDGEGPQVQTPLPPLRFTPKYSRGAQGARGDTTAVPYDAGCASHPAPPPVPGRESSIRSFIAIRAANGSSSNASLSARVPTTPTSAASPGA